MPARLYSSAMLSSVCFPLRSPVTRARPAALRSIIALLSLSIFSFVIATWRFLAKVTSRRTGKWNRTGGGESAGQTFPSSKFQTRHIKKVMQTARVHSSSSFRPQPTFWLRVGQVVSLERHMCIQKVEICAMQPNWHIRGITLCGTNNCQVTIPWKTEIRMQQNTEHRKLEKVRA